MPQQPEAALQAGTDMASASESAWVAKVALVVKVVRAALAVVHLLPVKAAKAASVLAERGAAWLAAATRQTRT